jgi:signal transduction histidine kinase
MGPGLLATVVSVVGLEMLFPMSRGLGWMGMVRLTGFVVAALLISLLNARQRGREKELAERNHDKDKLLALLAHELRAPLSAAVNALQALRLAGNDPRTRAEAQAILERQVRAMVRLVEDLLDVSRVGTRKLRLCLVQTDLKAAANEAVEAVQPLLEERRHRLEIDLPRDPVYLHADPSRLVQVIVNLLTNAARYTDPGGIVRLSVERNPGEVLVRVADTGMGLSPEIRDRIFDLFVQAEAGSRGGLGIGLNLVRGLVEMQGGKVAAYSAGPGHGSEFVVRFPTPAAPAIELRGAGVKPA